MGNASHIPWFGKPQEHPPCVPIFSKTIFTIHNEELGLCEPQQIVFKMPSAVPVMHFASIDNGLVRGIDTQHEVPRNFWPQQEVIIVNVTNDNIKELVRIGHKKKQLTLYLMNFSPRAMIPKMKIRLGKLKHITDYVITFMLNPERDDIGKIEKLDKHGFKNAVLFYCEISKIPAHQVPVYENLVLNPGLISMPPEEFNEYVAQITQAQAHAEEYARKPIEVPRDLPDLKGRRCNTNSDIGGLVVDKLSPDELKISWSKLAWTANDWIGMFRPHCVAPALYIARFTVKDHTQSLNVKMYPVPYGDLVLRYFRAEENISNSDTFSFGEDITLKVIEADAGLRIEVAGDLPKHWSLSVADNAGQEVARVRPEEEGTRIVYLRKRDGEEEEESIRDDMQVRVIADLWSDCLAIRSL